MVTDFAVEKRAAFLVSQGVRMPNQRRRKSVATAATLARAIQEVDTDLLNGFNHLRFFTHPTPIVISNLYQIFSFTT